MDEAFLRVFQQETTDDEDEINLNDCWTNKYRYISFLLMFSCGAMQFEVYEELERFLNGGAFIFIYSMSTIILAMPVVYTEMFLGQYTKFSFTQIWRVAPIFFGYGFSVILMNSFYLLITAMNVAQTLIYWVLSLSKSENLYQCHDTYESDSKSIDALCYNVKLSVPLSYHSCSYLEPLHIRCSETDKPVQYPALNFYWEFFWDPQLNTDLFSTYFMVALIFVWIITCAILILGLSILNRLVTVSLFLVVIIKIGMLFVVNVSKFQLTEAELMNKFKIDLGKLLSLRVSGFVNIFLSAYILNHLFPYRHLLPVGVLAPLFSLVIIGILIVCSTWLGWKGAMRGYRPQIVFFLAIIIVVITIELAIGTWNMVEYNRFETVVEDSLNQSYNSIMANPNSSDVELWNKVQKNLKCCGVYGPSGYTANIPASCCVIDLSSSGPHQSNCPGIYQRGCVIPAVAYAKQQMWYTLGISFLGPIMQFTGIFCNYYYQRAMLRDKKSQILNESHHQRESLMGPQTRYPPYPYQMYPRYSIYPTSPSCPTNYGPS